MRTAWLGAVALLLAVAAIAMVAVTMIDAPVSLKGLNDKAERASEDSFFDSILAKDSKKRGVVSKNQPVGDMIPIFKRAIKEQPHAHGKTPAHKKVESMQQQIKTEQKQIQNEKAKMGKEEEHAKVRAEEQRTAIERARAQKQAREYEQHLNRLNNHVFPKDSKAARKHPVSHALTDGLQHHVPVSAREEAPKNYHGLPRTTQMKYHAVHKAMMHAAASKSSK